ncbi:hypothetical protein CVIRNUC_009815 [Coccomyxa viridis]|uniref:Uncharacterized protein n=1 Tax=Coccomyxa viridis TaxID=1274662 RepID=A0AAV1IH07_9CHLO|nr:hypothetical protein CVIRNUC_009815 [Coccomyxa viridis]
MPPRALPSSKPKTAAEKWKAWLNSEYKDEQKFAANLSLARAVGLFAASLVVITQFGEAFAI